MVSHRSSRNPLEPRPGTYDGFEREASDPKNLAVCAMCSQQIVDAQFRLVTYLNGKVILRKKVFLCSFCHAYLTSETPPPGTPPLREE